MRNANFPDHIQKIFTEFIPICRQIAGDQRYAISVGGSLGKGTWDERSDVDFRLFTDQQLPSPNKDPGRWVASQAAIDQWKERGINIDGIWPRTVGEIDAALDGWLSGKVQPVDMVWTIWGYYILPDIANQLVIDDPYGIIAGWKERLSVYPHEIKQVVLKKYLGSLAYWRQDYHYAHKVERGDPVFLAGLASRLVHECIQVLFALNQAFFVGDGSNMAYLEKFQILPENFCSRVESILFPQGREAMADQYARICSLIDDVMALAKEET